MDSVIKKVLDTIVEEKFAIFYKKDLPELETLIHLLGRKASENGTVVWTKGDFREVEKFYIEHNNHIICCGHVNADQQYFYFEVFNETNYPKTEITL